MTVTIERLDETAIAFLDEPAWDYDPDEREDGQSDYPGLEEALEHEALLTDYWRHLNNEGWL